MGKPHDRPGGMGPALALTGWLGFLVVAPAAAGAAIGSWLGAPAAIAAGLLLGLFAGLFAAARVLWKMADDD